MKCAVELLAIRAKADEEYRIEQERKDLEAFKEFMAITKETINFCDTTINDRLVERAEDKYRFGGNIKVNYIIDLTTDRLGNNLFQIVTSDTKRYKDGGFSYSPKGQYYSYDILKDYIESHCLTITLKAEVRRKYGYGECEYINMTIEVPKP